MSLADCRVPTPFGSRDPLWEQRPSWDHRLPYKQNDWQRSLKTLLSLVVGKTSSVSVQTADSPQPQWLTDHGITHPEFFISISPGLSLHQFNLQTADSPQPQCLADHGITHLEFFISISPGLSLHQFTLQTADSPQPQCLADHGITHPEFFISTSSGLSSDQFTAHLRIALMEREMSITGWDWFIYHGVGGSPENEGDTAINQNTKCRRYRLASHCSAHPSLGGCDICLSARLQQRPLIPIRRPFGLILWNKAVDTQYWIQWQHFYRLQTKFAKVMISQVSVCP